MKRAADQSSNFETRQFWYRPGDYQSWIKAHASWSQRKDASAWGCFASQAASGRYMFSNRNQPKSHFGETFVGWHFEQRGYVCWTNVRIFRQPRGRLTGQHAVQTRLVEALLQESAGIVPQEKYEQAYETGMRLKRIDLVGFHFGRNHWIFSEVKKDHDTLHPEQQAALVFLRGLFSHQQADVFIASVQVRGTAG